MSKVLAALGTPSTASAVLPWADAIAALSGSTVSALHAGDGDAADVERVADEHGVHIDLVEGPASAAILRAMADPAIIAAVLGPRRAGRGGPVEGTAGDVLAATRKAVVVAPSTRQARRPAPLHRALVPLDGTHLTSDPIRDQLEVIIGSDVEIEVLHMFTDSTVPRILDRPQRDLELWGSEFLARHCPPASRIDLGIGAVGRRVDALCRDRDIDVIVLSWLQDASPGRAMVLREVLANGTVPVVVLPGPASEI